MCEEKVLNIRCGSGGVCPNQTLCQRPLFPGIRSFLSEPAKKIMGRKNKFAFMSDSPRSSNTRDQTSQTFDPEWRDRLDDVQWDGINAFIRTHDIDVSDEENTEEFEEFMSELHEQANSFARDRVEELEEDLDQFLNGIEGDTTFDPSNGAAMKRRRELDRTLSDLKSHLDGLHDAFADLRNVEIAWRSGEGD